MTRQEAKQKLAENLMLLSEALLSEDASGQFILDKMGEELKITSTMGDGKTVVVVGRWWYNEVEDEDEWAEFIEV